MTPIQLRDKTLEEVKRILEDNYLKLFKLTLQKNSGDLKTTHMLSETKRLIARLKTIISEKIYTQ